MAAIELDMAAAANRHNEIIERRNAVHLFSDNWPVRRWASAWVAEQKTAAPPDELSSSSSRSWRPKLHELVNSLPTSTVRSRPAVERAGRSQMGSVSRARLRFARGRSQPKVAELASRRTHDLGQEFAVPYLEVDG